MTAKKEGSVQGRPAQSGPVVVGVVGGRAVGWCQGQFAGDAMLLAAVRSAISEQRVVFLGRAVRAGARSPAEAVAALLVATPGVTISRAPEALLEYARLYSGTKAS